MANFILHNPSGKVTILQGQRAIESVTIFRKSKKLQTITSYWPLKGKFMESMIVGHFQCLTRRLTLLMNVPTILLSV